MPYEEELGQHPTIEMMQENVVEKKLRPRIPHEWRQHGVGRVSMFFISTKSKNESLCDLCLDF